MAARSGGGSGSGGGGGGGGGQHSVGQIALTPLGAGQHVGKSCLHLAIGGWRLLLDCGMHPGFADTRRFPDFSLIPGAGGPGGCTGAVDVVLLSHFHLDHSGALVRCTPHRAPLAPAFPARECPGSDSSPRCSRTSRKCWVTTGRW